MVSKYVSPWCARGSDHTDTKGSFPIRVKGLSEALLTRLLWDVKYGKLLQNNR